MEDALAQKFGSKKRKTYKKGLNPCCNGRCTRTNKDYVKQRNDFSVLILVVMEDALAPLISCIFQIFYVSLNPCCNGRCTRT